MDATFCPELDAMLRSRSAVGQSGRVFDQIGSVSTVNNLAVIRALMLDRKPVQTLEVGLGFGGSALAFAASHRDLGRAAEQQHVAFDPFQQSGWDDAGLSILARAGLDGFVDARSQPSATGLASLAEQNRMFGLIYVDGSHLFEDVFVDAYFALRLVAEEGIVLFDDCAIDHVAKVLSYIRSNWSDWTEEMDLGACHPNGATLKYRVARRLGRLQLRGFRRTRPGTRQWDVPLRRF